MAPCQRAHLFHAASATLSRARRSRWAAVLTGVSAPRATCLLPCLPPAPPFLRAPLPLSVAPATVCTRACLPRSHSGQGRWFAGEQPAPCHTSNWADAVGNNSVAKQLDWAWALWRAGGGGIETAGWRQAAARRHGGLAGKHGRRAGGAGGGQDLDVVATWVCGDVLPPPCLLHSPPFLFHSYHFLLFLPLPLHMPPASPYPPAFTCPSSARTCTLSARGASGARAAPHAATSGCTAAPLLRPLAPSSHISASLSLAGCAIFLNTPLPLILHHSSHKLAQQPNTTLRLSACIACHGAALGIRSAAQLL